MPWGIHIDRAMIRKIKQDVGIYVLDLWIEQQELLNRICQDVLLASDILWACCEEQAKRRDMDRVKFEAATEGDSFESAVYALLESICDFFPNAEKRATFLGYLRAVKELQPKTLELMQLETLSASLEVDESLTRLRSLMMSVPS